MTHKKKRKIVRTGYTFVLDEDTTLYDYEGQFHLVVFTDEDSIGMKKVRITVEEI